MNYIPVGLDIAKHVIQLHMVDFHTGEMVDKQIKRDALLTFFANLEPCLIGMEACGGSQHWARELEKLGHKVRLMPGRFVKAFVMGNKNDVMDARAIWLAVQQPGSDMNRQHSGFTGTPFGFCDILRPFPKGREGNIVEFTILLAG